MLFDHISIGGGVIGFNSTEKIINHLIGNREVKNQEFNFAIIDKKIDNIQGGVAYSTKLSRHGYFNNPIRLSPKYFIEYIKGNKFKKELLSHLNTKAGYVDKIWKKKYFNTLNNSNKIKFDELYLPRASYGIWQKNRIFNLLLNIKKFNNNKKNIKINLFFFETEVNEIVPQKKTLKLLFNNSNFSEYRIKKSDNGSKLSFFKTKKIKQKDRCFNSLSCTVGIGLNPPKTYVKKKLKNTNKYIWDFYSEGSTDNLINLIKTNIKKNPPSKILRIFFIGYKAGLLESLPELNQLIINNGLKIKLFAISPSLETIQKAEFINKKDYTFKYLIKKI